MLAVKAHQIKATIRYVVKGERAIFYASERDKSYWPGDDHEVLITDVRSLAAAPSIEDNGFAMLREPTAVRDYQDAREIENSQSRLPAFGAHVDYGRRSIEDVARPMLGAQADYWLGKRVVLMNLWRPISTVYRTPLALCDASTVQSGDLHDSEIRGGLDDPNRAPLYGYNLSYNPKHRWYYTSRMQPDELFAFKLYDSDSARPQWTGHTAINDPESAPDSPPRQSMEIRTISFI
jgi:hypothetical protein